MISVRIFVMFLKSVELPPRVLETKEEGLERIGDIEVQVCIFGRIYSIQFSKFNCCKKST